MPVKTKSARIEMDASRFAQLAAEHPHPNRPRDRQAAYARAVLVDGKPPGVVAEEHGVTRQMVQRAVKLFRELDAAVPVAPKRKRPS